MMRRVLPALVAVAVLLTSLVVHGYWTGRWKGSAELDQAVARLDRVPLTVGTWKGETLHLELSDKVRAVLSGYLLRRYTDQVSGAQVTLLIICGHPGPVSVHTPDVCYAGAGYQPEEAPVQTRVHLGRPDRAIPFWTAGFRKDGPVAERLRLHWSWYGNEAWSAPNNPRLAFAGAPALYKMYVIRQVNPDEDAAEEDPGVRFIQRLVPELDKVFS